jgi:hypothetical protein
MFIYNVTTKVDWSISDEWVEWMRTEHIPVLLTTMCFEKVNLARLLDVDDVEGPTYAAQYYVSTKNMYDDYIENHAPRFREHAIKKWGNKFISFRTLMQII